MKDTNKAAHNITREIVQLASLNSYDLNPIWDEIKGEATFHLSHYSKTERPLVAYRLAMAEVKEYYSEYLQ